MQCVYVCTCVCACVMCMCMCLAKRWQVWGEGEEDGKTEKQKLR